MIKRMITPTILELLQHVPAVALLGPRQVGKTTMALHIGEAMSSLYLDLESPEDIFKLQDPLAYLSLHSDKLVIIDEMQRMPDLFPVLRGLIDKNRRNGKKGGHFLLLGSASMDLMRQSSESLAGRIHYQPMSGLNVLELPDGQLKDMQRLWFRGGFPESYLAATDAISMEWLEMLIRTYLERDLPQLGFRVSGLRLRRLWTMLAHLQGEALNYSKLAGNLEVDGKTVTHYLDILADLLLVRRLQPWHANLKKRLVKSPRYYIRDSGILHRLLGLADTESLLSHPVLGKSWEGFVIENLLSCAPVTAEAYYYRSAQGEEIDLLLKLNEHELWAVEIKHGLSPKISPAFHKTAEEINVTKKFVVYGGNDTFSIEHNTQVISLARLMRELKS